MPLAHFLARTVWKRNTRDIDLEEVVSVAYQGLVTAALRWDPTGREIRPEDLESGKAFAGYARQRILGTIMDWQRGADHVQRPYRRMYKLFVAEGWGAGKTEAEVAKATGIELEKVRQVIRAVEFPPKSLDLQQDTEFNDSLGVPSEVNVESSALETHIKTAVASSLSELPQLQQVVIALRYHTGMELQIIAAELGLSPTTVREAHTEAVLAMHTAMRSRVIDS